MPSGMLPSMLPLSNKRRTRGVIFMSNNIFKTLSIQAILQETVNKVYLSQQKITDIYEIGMFYYVQ